VQETAVTRPLRTLVLAGGALGTGGVYVPLGAGVLLEAIDLGALRRRRDLSRPRLVAIAADPRRGIATGLCHPDEGIVEAATAYVVGDRQIPNPPPRSEPPIASDSPAGSGDQKVPGRRKPALEHSAAATAEMRTGGRTI
jgi:hypothetical protein